MVKKSSSIKGKTDAAQSVQPTPSTGETAPLTPSQIEALRYTYDWDAETDLMTPEKIESAIQMQSTDKSYQDTNTAFLMTDFDNLVERGLVERVTVYRPTPAGEKLIDAEMPPAAEATPTKEKDLDDYIESLQFASKVGKLKGRDKLTINIALRFAQHLDWSVMNDLKTPLALSMDERLILSAYRARDYHVFSCIADDLLKDEKHATELERVKNYKPLESRKVSERDDDTFYTPLEMIAMDIVAYLAKGWIPRGVMFYDDNYIQMLFGVAETMLESLIEDHSYGEMGELGLWLRYRKEIEAAPDDEPEAETELDD